MYMRSLLTPIFKKLLTPGEKAALRTLLTEFKISSNHRAGLRKIRRKALFAPARINLGCGPVVKEGFLNVDLFPGGDLTLDLRRGLPFVSGSAELIFSEHFFEHIEYPEPIYSLFADIYRVLKPGGALRFSIPDAAWPLHDYRDGLSAPYFRACAENAWWHRDYCTTRMEHINFHFRQVGQHRFAYDEETARKVLGKAGFADVSRVGFETGLDSAHREVGSLFLLARK
jgi:predicted SAM-dependent methyltransferase